MDRLMYIKHNAFYFYTLLISSYLYILYYILNYLCGKDLESQFTQIYSHKAPTTYHRRGKKKTRQELAPRVNEDPGERQRARVHA